MRELNTLMMKFIKDTYSPSGKVSRATMLEMMKLVSSRPKLQGYINSSDWKSVLSYDLTDEEEDKQ